MEYRNLGMIVNDYNTLHMALSQGYKVLLCTEDPLPQDIMIHPNIVKVNVLLPPYEAVSHEVDGDFSGACNQYMQYLSASPEVLSIGSIIYVSALLNHPMMLYFGSEYSDLYTLQSLPTCLSNLFGLCFSPSTVGSIDLNFAPNVLRYACMTGLFTPMQILSYYPKNMAIPYDLEVMIANGVNAPVDVNDQMALDQFIRESMYVLNGQSANQYGQKYYNPFARGSYAADGGQR